MTRQVTIINDIEYGPFDTPYAKDIADSMVRYNRPTDSKNKSIISITVNGVDCDVQDVIRMLGFDIEAIAATSYNNGVKAATERVKNALGDIVDGMTGDHCKDTL